MPRLRKAFFHQRLASDAREFWIAKPAGYESLFLVGEHSTGHNEVLDLLARRVENDKDVGVQRVYFRVSDWKDVFLSKGLHLHLE